jgi:hypothetical protein
MSSHFENIKNKLKSIVSGDSDKPVKRPDGRYDNVDFSKATGYVYPPIKCSYTRRDALIFVCITISPRKLKEGLISLGRPTQLDANKTRYNSSTSYTQSSHYSPRFPSTLHSSKPIMMFSISSLEQQVEVYQEHHHSMRNGL